MVQMQCKENRRYLIKMFFLDDPAFTDVIRQAEAAIDAGVNPIRIYQVVIIILKYRLERCLSEA